MISKMISGIQWAIFRVFGPYQIKDMMNEIDVMMDAYNTNSVTFFPLGEYPFSFTTSSHQEDSETVMFQTAEERSAFKAGLATGIEIMGGSTTPIDDERSWDELTKSESISVTHPEKSGKLN